MSRQMVSIPLGCIEFRERSALSMVRGLANDVAFLRVSSAEFQNEMTVLPETMLYAPNMITWCGPIFGG